MSSQTSTSLRDQIIARMQELNVSQSELARRINKPRQYVWNLLNYDHDILPSSLEPILEALGLEMRLVAITSQTVGAA